MRQIITRLLLQGLGPIQEKCSIPLKDSVNLVGAYDPTDSIPEGAVFICINNGSRGGLVKLGTVLVCRSPSLHPGYDTTMIVVMLLILY